MKATTLEKIPSGGPKSATLRRIAVSAGLAALLATTGGLQAQPISVPNFSFESQTAPDDPLYNYVNIFIDSWQKIAEPAYYDAAIGTPYGIPWIGTAGVFLNTYTGNSNPYQNSPGNQAGYILAFPQVTLYQDLAATFDVGKSYDMTVGAFGKSMPFDGAVFRLSLYYRDGSANMVTVGSTDVTYVAANFPLVSPRNLFDFGFTVPTVQSGDAWAGENIGIKLESVNGSGGYWDLDNVRLAAVPEPSSAGLLAMGGAALLMRMRTRRAALLR
jgi:hypothetical protein